VVGVAPSGASAPGATAPGVEDECVGVDVRGSHGLREQPVEQEPAGLGRAAVEAEGELVKVVGQVLLADGTLMGAQAPALEQRGDAVDARERDVCRLVGRPRHGHAVSEALGGDVRVALPSVGVDEAAGRDGVDDEALEARGIDVWDVPQADAAYLASCISTPMTTIALLITLRPLMPGASSPRYVSSTSTSPKS